MGRFLCICLKRLREITFYVECENRTSYVLELHEGVKNLKLIETMKPLRIAYKCGIPINSVLFYACLFVLIFLQLFANDLFSDLSGNPLCIRKCTRMS